MAKLLLLTGMGADERLLEPQRRAFPFAVVAEWLELNRKDTLPAYAARVAKHYRVGPDWVVGGVSMGGMLAQEIARVAGCRAAVVIASCRHPRAIPRAAQLMERAASWMPDSWIETLRRGRNAWLINILGPKTAEQRALLSDMSDKTPVPRLRWSAGAIFAWGGAEDLKIPVHQIHGTRDRVIMHRRSGAKRFVKGGGHVINLTHPDEVNAVIERALSGKPPE